MNKKFIIIFFSSIVIITIVILFINYQNQFQKNQVTKADDLGFTKQGINEVINASNRFSFNLFSKIFKSESGNIFYSPYSIFAGLAMTYEGANGQTSDEIKNVFNLPDEKILRPNFAAIYNDLNTNIVDYELNTANALWVQKNFSLLTEFTGIVEKHYGGKAFNLDFIDATERSRETINEYTNQQTNNRISELIPAGFLNPMIRLVLTNSIYFKGTWVWEFDKKNTNDGSFKVSPEKSVMASMMQLAPEKTQFNYLDTESLQVLELPYKGDKLSMLILLPKNDLSTLEASLTSEMLNEYKSRMKETTLNSISIPKFKFETEYYLKDYLISLGMPTAFSGNADFSKMTGKKDLFIDSVIHKAFIEVNENGSEATAATAVNMALKASLPRKVFVADHPFVFLIQSKDTGNILFLGKVVDPTL